MKIGTTWKDLNRVPWNAIFRCAEEYKEANPDLDNLDYAKYLKDTWGIAHIEHQICVVDEKKYMMFLLRWA